MTHIPQVKNYKTSFLHSQTSTMLNAVSIVSSNITTLPRKILKYFNDNNNSYVTVNTEDT